MNHLAHFQLAGAEHHLIVGGFLGDFVKGRLPSSFDAAIDRGIRLHRSIDSFTDQHPVVKQSQARFSPQLRRFSPVITDIIFDHFLARHWRDFSTVNLATFSREVCDIVISYDASLPLRAQRLINDLHQYRRLEHYKSRNFVASALVSLSNRITRANPIREGYRDFVIHYDALEADFLKFFPDALAFSSQWQTLNPSLAAPSIVADS